jgi:hypothetical protein
MKHLWEFACQTEMKEYGPLTQKQKADNPSEWAGFTICMMLYLLYLVSMTCLLRYDEALRITWADVVFQVKDPQIQNHWIDATPELFLNISKSRFKAEDFRICLNLPFRKTHQYGGMVVSPQVFSPLMLCQALHPSICMPNPIALGCVSCVHLPFGGSLHRSRCTTLMAMSFAKRLAQMVLVSTQQMPW